MAQGCCCSATFKFFLGMLTLLFWAASAGLIYVGVYVFQEYHHYEQLGEKLYTLIPATIIMALGVFFFILGLIGCIGAFKEQRCLLGVYFSILLVILVGMIVTSALAYVYRNEVHTKVEENINKGLQKYGNDSVWTQQIDFAQSELHCCGLNNYSDWMNTPWHEEQMKHNVSHPYPTSCCVDDKCNYTMPRENDTSLYQSGCHDKLKSIFMKNLAVVAGTAACFAVVMMLGMICSCVLICRQKEDNPYLGLTSPDHMRV